MAEHISLEAALAELAVDPIGVLRASGVRGDAGICGTCPIAVWFKTRTGLGVIVAHRWAQAPGSGPLSLPEPVRLAIRAIDAGEHPELCR